MAMPPPMASPAIPIAGTPSQPNVIADPRARLKITPTIAVHKGVVLSPVARNAILKTNVVSIAGAKSAVQSIKSTAML